MVKVRVVDHRLRRLACRWPLIVASDNEGCLRRVLQSRSGKVARYPDLIALWRVDRVGLKSAAW